MKRLKIIISCIVVMLGLSCISVYATTEETATLVVQVTGIMNGDENGNMNLSKNVTRAEFTKMIICASTNKDNVSDESYYSPFGDVPYTFWGAGYIQLAVEKEWINGYTDGSFKPNNTIKLEEAVSIILKMLGYSNQDFTGAYPYAQLSKYRALNLDDNVTAVQGGVLSRRDCMYLIYNMLSAKTKQGQTYLTTLGYTQDTSGNINVYKLISENIDGPYVVETSVYDLGIELENISVERNDLQAEVSDIQKYDVVYYSDKLDKIWAYSKAISGTYQEISPSTTSPTSINISGKSYVLETDEAKYSVSANGSFYMGNTITALIGREGIVKVIDAKEYNLIIYGIVSSENIEIYTDANGNEYSTRVINIEGIDGNSYKVQSKKNNYDVGTLVKISYGASTPQISKVSKKALSGKVTLTKIGNYKLASNINIVDMNESVIKKIYISRIEGATLNTSDVYFYTLNSNDEINTLILNNFTGDTDIYGIMLEAENSSGNQVSGRYTYQLENKKTTITTNGVAYNEIEGPVKLTIIGNFLEGISKLNELKNIKEITNTTISNSSQTMTLSDDLTVYLKEDGQYYTLSLNEIITNFDVYNITAYYDKLSTDGGRVRLIIVR